MKSVFNLTLLSYISRAGIILLLLPVSLCMNAVSGQDRYTAARERMVKLQLMERGISHKATLEAMRKVKRHLFVPPGLMNEAYNDNPLPIGFGQTISQPYMVAYMTESIYPAKGMKVLEIGTGSGYQAAVLAEIVDSVFTIEIIGELGKQSALLLKGLGYGNVRVKTGDGFAGWTEHGPYDAILVTAAANEVPAPLFEQLREGGRMLIPLGRPDEVQVLALVSKINGRMVRKNLMPVRFVPFTRERNK